MKNTGKKNNYINILANLGKASILVVVIVLSFMLLINFLPHYFGVDNYVVVTNSMEPTINVGSAVWVNRNFDIAELEVDDIIAFYQDINEDSIDEIIIHYVANISIDGSDNYSIQTKREGVVGSTYWDDWTLTSEDVVGVYTFHISYIGKFFLFINSVFGKVVIIGDIIFIYFVIDFYKKPKEETKVKIKNKTEDKPLNKNKDRFKNNAKPTVKEKKDIKIKLNTKPKRKPRVLTDVNKPDNTPKNKTGVNK